VGGPAVPMQREWLGVLDTANNLLSWDGVPFGH
jgi:hypothetical protein